MEVRVLGTVFLLSLFVYGVSLYLPTKNQIEQEREGDLQLIPEISVGGGVANKKEIGVYAF